MKKIFPFLFLATSLFGQPRQSVNNADITGINHLKSGATLIADPGSTVTGFPGTGSVTSVAISLPAFLAVTGSPVTTSGTFAVTYSGTPLPKANGGTGLTNPSLVEGSGITITGSWPNQTINATTGGGGTVTAVTVATANGVSATVANQGTTPALTVSLGAITPTTVNGQTITTGTGTLTLANHTVTAAGDATISGTSSGTNTGDQTITLTGDATGSGTSSFATTVARLNGVSLSGLATGLLKNTTSTGVPSIAVSGTDYVVPSGNVATATALQTSRTINGVSFNGTANIIVPAAANTLTGTTLASNVTASSLLSAAGGNFGTAAFTAASSYEVPLNFISPLSRSTNNISVGSAAADGSTQGVASFSASDFNSSGGNIALDYTNAQSASAGTKGFLTSTDWSTFNGKENVLTFTGGLSRTTNTVIIADTAVTPSTYTNATITVDQKGRITAASNGSSSGVTSVAATAPSFLSVSGSPITSTGTLAFTYSGTAIPVTSGGTGVTTMTSNSVVLGNGTGAVNFVAPGTTGNALISNGTTWTSTALTGGGNALTSNPLSQFAATTSAQFAGVISDETGSGLVVLGTSPTFTTQITTPKIVYSGSITETFGSGSPEGVITAAVGSVFHRSDGGAATTLYVKESGSGNSGWVPVGGGSGGTVTVPNGGTGLTTLTANNVILGNGTSTPLFVAPGTTGNALVSNGTTWTSTSLPGGGNALTSNPLSQFASTTSAQLAGVLSDETGTGVAVFGTGPTFTTQAVIPKIVYTGSVIETSGTGSPEGVVTASVGSVFHRTDGGSATTLYVKESGSGNTGWVASGGGGGGIGGSTGSTDKAILRANGTGGSTVQTSAITINDSGTEIKNPTDTISIVSGGGGGNVDLIPNGSSIVYIPSNNLEFSTTAGSSLPGRIRIYGTIENDSSIGLRTSSVFHEAPGIFMSTSLGTDSSPLAIGIGDNPFGLYSGGYDGSNWVGTRTNAFIRTEATENWSSGAHGMKWTFYGVTTGGTSQTKQFEVYGDKVSVATQAVIPKIVYSGSVIETFGTGSPEGVVTASVGSVFHRTDGGSSSTLYVKESGSGNTGWVPSGGGGGSGTVSSGTAGFVAYYSSSGTTVSNSTLQVAGSASTPEGTVTAPAGSQYNATNGSMFFKESGSGNTGWIIYGRKGVSTALGSVSAPSGWIGEYVTGLLGSGSAISLTSGTGANVTSVTIPADGVWQIDGYVGYIHSGTTVISDTIQGAGFTSATPGTESTTTVYGSSPPPTGTLNNIVTIRQAFSSGQVIYLVTKANFSISTLTAWGRINASRVW